MISFAWTPFLHPLPMNDAWLLMMLPMVAAIAIVYKTIKLKDMAKLPREVAKLSLQIIAFMAVAAALLWVLTDFM